MLHLTHTLAVNPAGREQISLEQLWQGLLLRITDQMRFTIGLDQVEILEQTQTSYRRALHFGAHVVYDRVNCVPYESIEFITDETPNMPSGRLLIQILGAEHLRLNFEYITQFPEASDDEERKLLEIIKEAYLAADTDMIRIIRESFLITKH